MDKILFESQDETLQFVLSADGTDYCQVDRESVLFRRLQHYRHWCLEHQKEYRYLQIFSDWDSGELQTFSRPILLEPQNSDEVLVSVSPRFPHPHPSLQFSIVNSVIDVVSDGLLIAETESIAGGSRITFLNQPLLQITGYSERAFLGLPLDELYAGALDSDAVQQLKSAQKRFATSTVDLILTRFDGTPYRARIEQSALADETGWYTHFVSNVSDVTSEVKQLELRNRERQLSLRMQEMAKTGWWRLNLKSRAFEADDGMLAICETKTLSTAGVDLLKYVVVTDQPRLIDLIKRCHSTGLHQSTELRILTQKGNSKWLRVFLEPEEIIEEEILFVLATVIDITDVVESERSRHEQHDELKFYLDCIDEYSFVLRLDESFRVTFVNDLFCEALGYSRSEVYGSEIENFAPDGVTRRQDFMATLRAGKSWRGEWTYPTKQGALRVFDVFASPRLDSEGNLEEVLSFLYDISTRKLSDQVSEMAASIRAETADLPILDLGLKRLIQVSGSTVGALRIGKEWFVYPDKAFVDHGAAAQFPLRFDEFLEGSLYLDGRPGGYSSEVKSLLQPVIDAVLETEHTHRQERLRERAALENRYILNTLKIGSWRFVIEEDAWFFSESLFALLQFQATPRGLVPQKLWGERMSHSELKKLSQSAKEMLRRDGNCEVIVRANLPQKQRVYIKVQGRLIRSADGEPEEIVGIASDVSQEVRTQRELENSKSLAGHQARLASIGELAAGVGHEINNPLTIIRGFLDITKNALMSGQLNEETVLDLIDKMDESAARIGKIVGGLRSLSHADQIGEASFEPESILRSTVGFVEEIYLRDGIEIDMETKVPVGLRMKGYEGKLQQVVMNLLSNARDATEGQAERKISTRIYLEQDDLIISVEDNGPGVPDAIRERIFHPFFTTKEIGKGTGIGLSMVFCIVQEFKGAVQCQNGPMGGAEFLVRLPLSENVATEAVKKEVIVDSRPTELVGRILVVDDEAGVREFLMLMLGQMGLVVDTAPNGKAALDVFFGSPKPYDLVITDLTMPEMGGLEFLDELQLKNTTLAEPRLAKVLLCSGLPDFTFDADRYPMVVGLLNKPFNLALLRKRLLTAGLGESNQADQEKARQSL